MAENDVKPMETDQDEAAKKVPTKEEAPAIGEPDLSDADKALKEMLEGLVEKLDDAATLNDTLVQLRTSITASTSTMTSVPKPLKFLRPHFETIKTKCGEMEDATCKAICSDVVSLLAMTQDNGLRDCLNHRLTGSDEDIATFGHEYIRHLTGEIANEYADRTTAAEPKDCADLLELVGAIVPYNMKHNAEAEACDLAMEVEQLELLLDTTDVKAYSRVCLYLLSCVPFVPEPQDTELQHICLKLFRKFDQYPQAMQMALKLNDLELIQEVFLSAEDMYMKRQLAFMLARQQVVLDLEELIEDDPDVDELISIMSNQKLNENFLALARELDIMEPKSPEDVYKTHLETAGRSTTTNIDSARANLASTFVNAFVNAGFGQDKLILNQPTGANNKSWITARNKADRSQFSATASLGMILMWDGDGGLQKIDQYMLSSLDYVKGGSLLAVGVIFASVADDNDPAKAILDEYVTHDKQLFRLGACMGLGLAYAGSKKKDVGDRLLEALVDPKSTMEVIGVTAIALGQIFVGTCDGDYTEAIITLLGEKTKEELATTHGRAAALGLGLLYLGKQQEADVAMMSLVTLDESFQKTAKMVLDMCAYAGTGNVLKIQSMLHTCSEHVDTEKEGFKEGDDAYQAFAALGVAVVAMGEETGVDMVMRMFNHLLRYGEPVIRRAVPLAIALLCTSNPKLSILDTLSKLSHDADAATAHSAILAIGIVGGGTNHARIANMLRLLAQYYSKDSPTLFVVRLAQGIVHAGKGSITFSPFHTERSLMSPVAVSGLLAVMVSGLDMAEGISKDSHFMMYHLALAMYPRIFCSFSDDEELTPINTSVRVGQAVDVVGQAGSPKTITGFVTNNTPVLLGYGERAQLASEEYLPLTPLLEGFVILKKNPDYEA